LQAVGGAVVVGERTHGKGSVQTVHTLFNNGYAFVTESWFTVPDGDGGRRLIDRYRAEKDWGIEPDLPVGETMGETMKIMSERGRWHSGRGLDVRGAQNTSPTLATTTDRELLLAVALLRARLLPTYESIEWQVASEGTAQAAEDQ
jgi:C-terminal processing protease CtpA/Prc